MPALRSLALWATALWALAGCGGPASETPAQHTTGPVPVTVITVAHRPLSTRHTVAGTLQAVHRVEIYNQVEGLILELPYHEGDPVHEGALLVRLDDRVIRAQLLKAQAQRRQAELDLSRQIRLLKNNAASEDEVAQARTALELARADEALQRTLLDRALIHAPFTGVISERLKEPGDVVPVHTHILSLLDPTGLLVSVPVSELRLARLHKGESVTVRIDALPTGPFPGTVLRVHPTIDPETRQGILEIALRPVPEGAMPGQLARVEMVFDAGARLTVPLAALGYDRVGPYVYRVDPEGVARRVRVAPGAQFGERIEILSGLHDGEHIVVSGFVDLRDGRKVEIAAAGHPAASATPVDLQ